jgi:PilZ domain
MKEMLPVPRRSARVGLDAEVTLRRAGHGGFRVKVVDLSCDGCKTEFVERPALDEVVRIKFAGLESLGAAVCWIRGCEAGLEFERPLHPAVFDMLVKQLNA